MNGQHLDDIEIPDVEIGPGWRVSAVTTKDQCNDAFAYLMAACAEIEYHLELYDVGQYRYGDSLWAANARRALKYKKTALQIVNTIRSQISERQRRDLVLHKNRVLLDHIRDSVSTEQFETWIKASGILNPVEMAEVGEEKAA